MMLLSLVLAALTLLLSSSNALAKSPDLQAPTPLVIPVQIYAALTENHSFVPEKIRQELKFYIEYAQRIANQDASACGYQFAFEVISFVHQDNLALAQLVKEHLTRAPWLIIGPQQSNAYSVVAQQALQTPTLSAMASSKEALQLGPLHQTFGVENRRLVQALFQQLPRFAPGRLAGKSYLALRKGDSINSVNFIEEFDLQALKSGLKKAQDITLHSDLPEWQDLEPWLRNHTPDFIVLPIKGDLAAAMIPQLHVLAPQAILLGGDSWGDLETGPIAGLKKPLSMKGMMVRPFPPYEQYIQYLKNKTAVRQETAHHLAIGVGGSYLLIAEALAAAVCRVRPRTAEDFKTAFLQAQPPLFQNPAGPVVYFLKDGNIHTQP